MLPPSPSIHPPTSLSLSLCLSLSPMADMKQPPLNGAYYGPPVPPQQNYRRRRGCNPCGCLLCTLLKFVVSIVVILGIAVLVLWLILRPNEIKVYVEDASLTQFNFSGNSNLQYNLSLDMSIRNPNRKIGIYYDYIEARALYSGSRFGFTTLPPFYLDHKSTATLQPKFRGQSLLLGDTAAATYTREKGEGSYYIEVKLYTTLRLKIWFFKLHHVNPEVDCVLKLGVPGSPNATAFQRTECDVNDF